MFRYFLPLVLPLVIIALAPAAPIPKHLMKDPPVYFPMQKGSWEYKWGFNEQDLIHLRKECVTEIMEDKDGSRIVTLEDFSDKWKFRVSPRGIFELERNGVTFNPPLICLQLPAHVGDTWTNTYAVKETKYEEVLTFRGSERVKVSAGTFDALRVDVTVTMNGVSMPRTFWYVPHIGMVKRDFSGTIHELHSFTPSPE